MLTIRPEQLEILSQAEDRKYEQQLLALLRKHYSEHPSPPLNPDNSLALEWLRQRFDQASSFEIEFEGDIAIFIILTLEEPKLCIVEPVLENENSENQKSYEVEENDDFLSWVYDILLLEDTPGDIKISLIEHQLKEDSEHDVRSGKIIDIIESVREIFG